MPRYLTRPHPSVGPEIILLYIFVSLSAVVAARADISPTTFIGSGITPSTRSPTSIRMEKAEVEIVWGTPCMLSATFKMVSPTESPEELGVGFPMPRLPWRSSVKPDTVSISFNETEPTSMSTEDPEKQKKTVLDDWLWSECKHTFTPGVTTVVVKSILRPSREKFGRFRESLFYCIQSGADWAGTIGDERVTIRFPYPIVPEQVTWAQPAGYKIEGNQISWHFTDFEPRGKEFDIGFCYIRPNVMQVLQALRREQKNNPASSSAATKLAKHLLVLGDPWSSADTIPSRLSAVEYKAILEKLNAADGAVFRAHYAKLPDGQYLLFYAESSHRGSDLLRVFAEVGYRGAKPHDPFVDEGEALLRNVLKRDRHNAEAWNIYLAHYWRFNFAAYGRGFGSIVLSNSQRQAIKNAAKNCPNDECIKCWVDILKYERPDTELPAVREAIERSGWVALDYPSIEYGYY